MFFLQILILKLGKQIFNESGADKTKTDSHAREKPATRTEEFYSGTVLGATHSGNLACTQDRKHPNNQKHVGKVGQQRRNH